MKRICVFCGAKTGRNPVYRQTAAELGRLLASRQLGLVFGGGSVGLMGAVADAALDSGGEVIGVIPRKLARKELRHPRVAPMHIVESMHERKALMAELADAFVALPGGLGTFEELFEVVTWAQLGYHAKPIGLLDIGGYFQPLIQLIEHAVKEGFIRPKHRQLIVVDSEPASLLDRLATHRLPSVPRWLGPQET